jgi:hypothetical protein
MKYLGQLALLLLLFSCFQINNDNKSSAYNSDPFSKIYFDKVVAYDFTGNSDISLIDSNGNVTKTVTKSVVLDSNQLKEFKLILMDSTTFGEQPPKDFYPHLGLIFYNGKTIVEYLEVSLLCTNVFASFDIPQKQKRINDDNGLTQKGVYKIFKFCKKLGFKNYLDEVKL